MILDALLFFCLLLLVALFVGLVCYSPVDICNGFAVLVCEHVLCQIFSFRICCLSGKDVTCCIGTNSYVKSQARQMKMKKDQESIERASQARKRLQS